MITTDFLLSIKKKKSTHCLGGWGGEKFFHPANASQKQLFHSVETKEDDRRRGGKGERGAGERKVPYGGKIWIRLSPGGPSPSRINALKFFVFSLNGFKEAAGGSALDSAQRRCSSLLQLAQAF